MAYNSTIKQKTGECIDCNDGIVKPIIAGRCSNHYKQFRSKVGAKRNKMRSQDFDSPNKLGIVQLDEMSQYVEGGSDSISLSLWFLQRTNELSLRPVCMECGAAILKPYYRDAIAHIFPKSPNSGFPSVATARWNFLFLGAGCGCHEKTHRLDTFSKMKVWPLAVKRFLTFENDIKETRKYHHLFKQYANDTI